MKRILWLLTLLASLPAFGTTFVSAGSGRANVGASTSITVAVTTGAHHVMVISNNLSSTTPTPSISDTLGTTKVCDTASGTGTDSKTQTCYVLDSGTGGSNTITCSSSSAANIGCLVLEYDMGAVPTLKTKNSATGASSTSISVSTSVANATGDLGVYAIGSGSGAVTTPSGYTCRMSPFDSSPCTSADPNNFHVGGENLSLSSGTQTVTATQTSGTWTAQIYVFTTASAMRKRIIRF